MLLVNKENLFNEDMLSNFTMVDYENYNEDTYIMEYETFRHFEMLKAHLKVEGLIIDIDSAYRSLEKQENLFLEFMNKYGIDYAESIVAMPGTSEHHTGQALDLVLCIDGEWIDENAELMKYEDVFKKIHSVLKYFGFILRYPKGKEDITGYPYEPWHIRYIGEGKAMEIGDLTLEEFLSKKNK